MKQDTAAEQVTQEELAIVHASRKLGNAPSGQPWGLVILAALASLEKSGYGELTVKIHGNEIKECVKSEKLRSVNAA